LDYKSVALLDFYYFLPYLPIHLNEVDTWGGIEGVNLATGDVEDFGVSV
jgi:hypothetical protein